MLIGVKMKISYRKIVNIAFRTTLGRALLYLVGIAASAMMPVVELFYFNRIIEAVAQGESPIRIRYIVLYFSFSILFPNMVGLLLALLENSIQEVLEMELAGNALYKSTKVGATNVETGEGVNNVYRASQTQNDGVAKVFFLFIALYTDVLMFGFLLISIGIIGVIPAFLGGGLALVMYKIKSKLSEESNRFYWSLQEDNRYCDSIYEMLNDRNCAGEIRLFNTYDWLFDQFQTRKRINHQKERDFRRKIQREGSKVDWLQTGNLLVTIMFFYILSYMKVLSGAGAVTGIYASTRIYGMISGLVDKYNQYRIQRIIIDEYNILQKKEEEYTSSTCEVHSPIKISATELQYRYRNAEYNALEKLSFEIAAGEKVVLVGENGSGKTTLIRLLLGFDKPSSGAIFVNGIPSEQCMKSFRKNVTYMGQNYFHYDLLLKDNIVISDPSAEKQSAGLEEAVRWAGLEEVIEKLERGLATEIMQGNLLSGGEWQRVALARMKYRERDFIVMDEPNAAVDAEYEISLYRKLLELAKEKTMVVVSHRLPICQIADRIIVMKEGKIVETGTHKELIQKQGGIYKSLFEAQAKLYTDLI